MATTKDLHELIAEEGMDIVWVASRMPVSYWRLYRGPLSKGQVTPQEIDRLAEVLRLPREQVEAAVRESARRHAEAKAQPQPLAHPKGGAA